MPEADAPEVAQLQAGIRRGTIRNSAIVSVVGAALIGGGVLRAVTAPENASPRRFLSAAMGGYALAALGLVLLVVGALVLVRTLTRK